MHISLLNKMFQNEYFAKDIIGMFIHQEERKQST
jgi:hypothetical protein